MTNKDLSAKTPKNIETSLSDAQPALHSVDGVSRRTITHAAWAVPVIAAVTTAPLAAATAPVVCAPSILAQLDAGPNNSWRNGAAGNLRNQNLVVGTAPFPGMYLKITLAGGGGGGATSSGLGKAAMITTYIEASMITGRNVRMIAGGAGAVWGDNSGNGNSYGGRGFGDGGHSSGPYSGGGGGGSALFIDNSLTLVAGGGGGYPTRNLGNSPLLRRDPQDVPFVTTGSSSPTTLNADLGAAGLPGADAQWGRGFILRDQGEGAPPGTNRVWLEGGGPATTSGPGVAAKRRYIAPGAVVDGSVGNAFNATNGGRGGNGTQVPNPRSPLAGGSGGGGGYHGGGGGGAGQFERLSDSSIYENSGGAGGGGSSFVTTTPVVPLLGTSSLTRNNIRVDTTPSRSTFGNQGFVTLEWVCNLGA